MPHLGSFRKGWESENIARFILHRFSFIAHPATIADDVGSDFFCTLFHTIEDSGTQYLLPRNSFAIQIKSTDHAFDVSDKAEYLEKLEIPYLVGVVNRDKLSLTIYSGEYIPAFFSYKGVPASLKIEPCDRDELLAKGDYHSTDDEVDYTLRFPKLVSITGTDTGTELADKVEVISAKCSLIYENIVSKRNHEYIFRESTSQGMTITIFAGSGSNKVYRNNLVERLAEAFVNLKWILSTDSSKFVDDEFRAYESFLQALEDLEKYYGPVPQYVKDHYVALRDQIAAL